MKRVLPALAAFALVIVGVGAGILLLTSRDHSSIGPAASTTPSVATAKKVDHLPAGNIVVEFSRASDGAAVDQLAEQLGAVDTRVTRTAGQALVSKKVDTSGVVARSVNGDLVVSDATDPRLAAFVRQNLGRTSP